MTDLDRLRAALDVHGFKIAAKDLELHPRFAAEALASWVDYPGSMDRFPKIVTGRKAVR